MAISTFIVCPLVQRFASPNTVPPSHISALVRHCVRSDWAYASAKADVCDCKYDSQRMSDTRTFLEIFQDRKQNQFPINFHLCKNRDLEILVSVPTLVMLLSPQLSHCALLQ